VAPNGTPESFAEFAFQELAAAPNWVTGVCANPYCSADFIPSRESQKFCCDACKSASVAELRRWGLRFAPALLIARETKYAAPMTAQAELRRAARSYLTQGSTLWLNERKRAVQDARAAQ
jgi:hypothetical protein